MTPFRAVLLILILSAFAGWALGHLNVPGWVTWILAFIIALAGTRWVEILRKK